MIARATCLILSLPCLPFPAAHAAQTDKTAASQIAGVRTAWIDALQHKQVETSVALYAPDASFLDPSGARFQGASELRSLYRAVTGTYDALCHLNSRSIETSGDLAFDSGDYDEVLTVRATAAVIHTKGTYLTVYRRTSDHWLIVQQAWTLAKPD